MKQTAKNRSKSRLIIVVCIIFVVIASMLIYKKIYRSNSTLSSAPTAAETKLAAEIAAENKRKSVEAANNDATGNKGDSYPTSTPSSQNQKITVSPTLGQNNDVIVSTRLENIPSGTCDLTITNGTTTLNKATSIIYQPEFSTCAGFSINKSELGMGTWGIKISVVQGEANIVGSASIEVK